MKLVTPSEFIDYEHSSVFSAVLFWSFVVITFFSGSLIFFLILSYFFAMIFENIAKPSIEKKVKKIVSENERKKELCNRLMRFYRNKYDD